MEVQVNDVKRQPPNLLLASALAGVLSGKAFANLKVELGPMVCYFPDRDVVQVPALPFGEVDSELRDDLLSYLAHEAAGERDETTWHKQWDTMAPPLRFIVNGMNDARIDAIVAQKWPGAGIALRKRVEKDMIKMFEGDCSTVTHLACGLRYLGEGFTTPDKLREKVKLFTRVEDIVATVDWTSEDDIVAKARAIWDRLQEPPPPPEPQSEQDEDEQDEDEQDEDEQDEESENQGDSSDADEEEGDEEEGEGDAMPSSGNGESEDDAEQEEGEGDEQEEGDAEDGEAEELDIGDMKSVEDRLAEKIAVELQRQPPKYDEDSARFSFPTDKVEVKTPHMFPNAWRPSQVARFVQLFAALRDAPGREITSHQQYGELDLDLLPVALGGQSDRVQYRRVRTQSQKIAVHLSCDATGSIYNKASQGYFAMLASIGEALRRLSVPWSATMWHGGSDGFGDESHYTQPYDTTLYRVRMFEDSGPVLFPLDRSTNRPTIDFGNNADMPGLLEAYAQLATRPEEGKLLFYFTDGLPVVDWKGSQRNGILRRAMAATVKQMRGQGIDVVGIGIGMNDETHETMDKIFTAKYWVPVDDPTHVSTAFIRGVQAVVQRLRQERR
jgi:hypothetical protein